MIVGSVEASYFTATQQQLIHDFVDRRGGGLLFMGGRATLSHGGYQGSPLADLVPTQLPPTKGGFTTISRFVKELTPQGARRAATPVDDEGFLDNFLADDDEQSSKL